MFNKLVNEFAAAACQVTSGRQRSPAAWAGRPEAGTAATQHQIASPGTRVTRTEPENQLSAASLGSRSLLSLLAFGQESCVSSLSVSVLSFCSALLYSTLCNGLALVVSVLLVFLFFLLALGPLSPFLPSFSPSLPPNIPVGLSAVALPFELGWRS